MYNQIINAINTAASGIANAPTLYTENQADKPAIGSPYMRTTLLPSEPVPVTSGINRMLSFTGIMQLDYFTPPGTTSTVNMVDTIVEHFNNKDNRFLTETGQEIMITAAWRGTSSTETKWYRTPIFLRYQAYDK